MYWLFEYTSQKCTPNAKFHRSRCTLRMNFYRMVRLVRLRVCRSQRVKDGPPRTNVLCYAISEKVSQTRDTQIHFGGPSFVRASLQWSYQTLPIASKLLKSGRVVNFVALRNVKLALKDSTNSRIFCNYLSSRERTRNGITMLLFAWVATTDERTKIARRDP